LFKLGVDIDGTINDFSNLIYKCAVIYNEGQGIYKNVDMSDYSMERYFNWTDYQNNEFWTKYYKHALINTVPHKGVVQALSLLKDRDVAIYFITARAENLREITLEWLKKHNIQMDYLIMEKDKSKTCLDYCINLMIEDEPDNCSAISKHIPVLCMSYPYNQHLEGHKNIKRIEDWNEAYSEIKNYLLK
jgi:uncharacterized protein